MSQVRDTIGDPLVQPEEWRMPFGHLAAAENASPWPDGSQSKTARSWVTRNIGKNSSKTIGGVSFELIARLSRTRMLLIQSASEPAPDVSSPSKTTKPADPDTPPKAVTKSKPLREWNDSTGTFSIKATFVSRTFGKVTLRKEDGSTSTFDFKKLSVEDQQYIDSLR